MNKKINTFEEYKIEYKKSIQNPEKFWRDKAEQFTWKKKWDNVLSWDFTKPEIKWFEGGRLNITENCLDRHLEKRGNQIAIKWIAKSTPTPIIIEDKIAVTWLSLIFKNPIMP